MSDAKNLNTTDTKGYTSASDKRKYTNIAGIFCILFFLAQFVVPMVAMFSMMPSMMNSMMTNAAFHSGATWQGRAWFVEESVEGDGAKMFTEGPGPTKQTLKSLQFILPDEVSTADEVALKVKDPYLLAGEDKLWVITSSFTGFYTGSGKVISAVSHMNLGDISRPFFHNGQPTVIEENPTGFSLMTFDGQGWEEISSFSIPLAGNSCCFVENVRVLSYDSDLYFFLKKGGTLFYRKGIPDSKDTGRNAWSSIKSIGSGWEAVLYQGRPTVFIQEEQENISTIKGLQFRNDKWEEFFSHNGHLIYNFGVYPFEKGGFVLVQQTFPGSINTLYIDDQGNISSIDTGGSSFFPKDFMFVMFTPQLLMMLTPFILAIILTYLMKKYRIRTYSSGKRKSYQAPIIKRAIAQVVDSVIAVGPVVIGWFTVMNSFPAGGFDTGGGPNDVFTGFGFIGGGIAWVFICLIIYSFTEGSWGITPGKWLVGIRVMGTDLRPCGFGRGIIRNLLKFVDGFFNFMVGIMIVALSENWQRIGDMAARTVVIDIKEAR